ncbi:MAG: transposase [Terracidiphilus sp.]
MARKRQGTGIVESWQGSGEEDFLRGLVERAEQQVLETERTSFLGAGSYERSGERRGWRNGFKPRVLKTRVGKLELLVPKDREGQFQTELFERYQRSEKALVLSMLEMYIAWVSTRKVSAITEAARRETALEAIRQAVVEFEKRAPKVAELLEEHGEEILGVYALPARHRKQMRTTNLLERQNQELKRRTRVVRVFPDEGSCLRLVTALPMETNQEWMEKLSLHMDKRNPAVDQQAMAPTAA